jgi:hypothetical protein
MSLVLELSDCGFPFYCLQMSTPRSSAHNNGPSVSGLAWDYFAVRSSAYQQHALKIPSAHLQWSGPAMTTYGFLNVALHYLNLNLNLITCT